MGLFRQNGILFKYYPDPGVTKIRIPAAVREINAKAFENCRAITEVTLPEGLRIIGERAFSGCSGLTQIQFPRTLTEIRNFAFANCTALTAIHIPRNVKSVNRYAFDGCSGAKTLRVDGSATNIWGGAFPAALLVDSALDTRQQTLYQYLQTYYHLVVLHLIDTDDDRHLARLLECSAFSCEDLNSKTAWMNMLSYADDQDAVAVKPVIIRYIKEHFPDAPCALRL